LIIVAQPNRIGRRVRKRAPGEDYFAYVPPPLPPEPPVDLGSLYPLLGRADQAVGRLDGITTILPDSALFIYMYVRKEALLSSQIEGTQSSLSDLLLHETGESPGVPLDDVQEVSSYVAALNHGLRRLRRNELPLSLRLVREIHARLLARGRGSEKTPGEFRTSQNWIGGTRPGNALYVPPPPEEVIACLGDLEKFMHAHSNIPVLVRAALIHVQFESIHPFLDGNGRIGRLLITFLLCAEGILREPTLYLSLYFKHNRDRYYELLQQVRFNGDWEAWVRFFLEGVETTANQAVDAARRIQKLFERDREKIEGLGRAAGTALRLHNHLQRFPLTSLGNAAAKTKLSFPTVTAALSRLEDLGIVKETTGRERNRIFEYRSYVHILAEGTEPLTA
jgi:Fic family protein